MQKVKFVFPADEYEARKHQIIAAKLARMGVPSEPSQVWKVGPKGYEHGWIKVGAPGLKDRGFGTVFGQAGHTVENTGVAGAHMGYGGKGPHGTTHVITVSGPGSYRSQDGKYHVQLQRLNSKTGGESGGGKLSETVHNTPEEALARVDQISRKLGGNTHPYDES